MRTNAGADFQAAQIGSTSPGANGANWVAVTASVTAPAATDTTLTGEVVTAGGGLVRKQATYAHTTGTNTYTLTVTLTANGSDALPFTPGKRGVFTASSGGTMMFTTLVPTPPTLAASGDAVTLTDTVTM